MPRAADTIGRVEQPEATAALEAQFVTLPVATLAEVIAPLRAMRSEPREASELAVLCRSLEQIEAVAAKLSADIINR